MWLDLGFSQILSVLGREAYVGPVRGGIADLQLA